MARGSFPVVPIWRSWRRLYHVGATELQNKIKLKLTREHVLHDINDDSSIEWPEDPISRHYVRDIIQAPGSTYGGLYRLAWEHQPRNILIVKKPNDERTGSALVSIASWLHQRYPETRIIVEPDVADHFKEQLPFVHVIPNDKKQDYARVVDFAVTLGGDGTMLHFSSLFPKAAPPVLCFSLGSLGFLMPFHTKDYRRVLDDMMRGQVSLTLRMRLFCSLHQSNGKRITYDDIEVGDRQAMNEVSLHRGRSPHLTSIECFVDDHCLTKCVADGLIVSTPTGSTAYSLSAGGPIVHPSVQSLLLTPICPRSLSFRPVLLPPGARIQLKMGDQSRSQTEVTIDGQEIFLLKKGEYVQARMSKYPIPCVMQLNDGSDWAQGINELLKWNYRFGRTVEEA